MNNKDVGIAFLVCFLAGFSTAIGAAVPLTKQIKITDKRILAGALALAGGVMLFISLCEIVQMKAIGDFMLYWNCDKNNSLNYKECYSSTYFRAVAATYGIFFLGVILCAFLDQSVHKIVGGNIHFINQLSLYEQKASLKNESKSVEVIRENNATNININSLNNNEKKINSNNNISFVKNNIINDNTESITVICCNDNSIDGASVKSLKSSKELEENTRSTSNKNSERKIFTDNSKDIALHSMTQMTSVTIALHNAPEGLATFIATYRDTKIGVALAVAIAIHNIPEGLAVAIPVYHITGSRQKAFLYGSLTGMAEWFGGIIAYLAFVEHFNTAISATLFALVGGMMTFLTFSQLLPLAFQYDKSGRIVVICFVSGMFAMAFSLVLFAMT